MPDGEHTLRAQLVESKFEAETEGGDAAAEIILGQVVEVRLTVCASAVCGDFADASSENRDDL
jgi:hypothetical protein